MKVVMVLLVGAAVVAAAPLARGDDKSAAEAEFVKAKKLLKEGKTADACGSFAKSQELDPQQGTQYNLALCYEQIGRTASAWLLFRELAQKDNNRTRKKDSKKRAAGLDGKLTKLLITVVAETPGLTITRGGVDVTRLVGIEDPVDPGAYQIVASAAGYQARTIDVAVDGPGATITVEIDGLDPIEAADPTDPTDPDRPTPDPVPDPVTGPVDHGGGGGGMPGRKKLALGVGGAGAVALGVGVVFGFQARSKWSDVEALCGADHLCAPEDQAEGQALVDDTRTAGNLSTILVGAGVVAVGAAVVLWITAPDAAADERAAWLTPVIGDGEVGVAAGGSW